MRLAPSTRGVAGRSLELARYVVLLWTANPEARMEAWSRAGRCWRDWDAGRWRLMRDGVQVPQEGVRT